jgi:hypothetical protein
MALKMKDKGMVNKFILGMVGNIEKALIYNLEYLVAKLQNHAKMSKGYENQTSNLVSSIGGAVVKDGKVVTYRGFDKAGGNIGIESNSDGTTIGKEFVDSLLSEVGSGYGIILVAGMEYATYVENYHNLNVLKKTELISSSEMEKMFEKLKRKIEGSNKWGK